MMSALSSSGLYQPTVLFPEWFGSQSEPNADQSDDGQQRDDSDVDFDYSAVEWKLPCDGDKDALSLLSQVMSANDSVTVGDESQDGEQDLPDGFIPDDEDREWV